MPKTKRIPNWQLPTELQFFNHHAIVNIIMLHGCYTQKSELYLNMLWLVYFCVLGGNP